MMGRAGRPKYDKEGEAVLISKNEDESRKIQRDYLTSEGKIFPLIPVEYLNEFDPDLYKQFRGVVEGVFWWSTI